MPEPDRTELSGVMHRNIQAMPAVRRRIEERKPLGDRIAHAISQFVGTIQFVLIHAVLVVAWVVINVGLVPFIPVFDPYPFVILPMAASLEAIFLTAFVLMGQNRLARIADQRADLDLQINLLSEHEVTKLLEMVEGIARRLGVPEHEGAHVEELKRDVHPETVLKEMERAIESEEQPPM